MPDTAQVEIDPDAPVTEECWDAVYAAIQKLAESRGDMAGYPMPLPGLKLVLEPRFPFPGLADISDDDPPPQGDPAAPLPDTCPDDAVGVANLYARFADCFEEVNYWEDHFRNRTVTVVRDKVTGKSRGLCGTLRQPGTSLRTQLSLFDASRAWEAQAELQAVHTLSGMISKVAFKYYILTGGFLESSRRSGLTYWFRKSRPTVVLSGGLTGDVRALVALCLHPIGYYAGTAAGVMVPTDDLIAHLVMMRGDEHKFWGKANHHNIWDPGNGV